MISSELQSTCAVCGYFADISEERWCKLGSLLEHSSPLMEDIPQHVLIPPVCRFSLNVTCLFVESQTKNLIKVISDSQSYVCKKKFMFSSKCDPSDTENEVHSALYCSYYHNLRLQLFNKVEVKEVRKDSDL